MKKNLALLALLVWGCLGVAAETGGTVENTGNLVLKNEFIKIVVNNEAYDRGRFSVETTLGDPARKSDDNQPLVFGRPKPWTSYTTIQIDGVNWVFGGETRKRAGKGAKYGQTTFQGVTSNRIVTVTRMENIFVTQQLEFFRNPLTKVRDTALITYTIENRGDSKKMVGARVMLDALLGSNDAAPFRIGSKAYQSEKSFIGKEILDYWQTFDQLSSPNVVAQGTLSLPESGIEPPSRMYLVNWGTLADGPWDFVYEEGRSFVRAGEFEKDTALALYWDPKSLLPGQQVTIRTLYGLGGVSLAPGALSLGLAAPAEIPVTTRAPILIVGYISNTGGFDSTQTQATFQLPPGFQVVEGDLATDLGTIGVGESRQIALKVLPDPVRLREGAASLVLTVKSGTLDSNTITRNIEVLGAPKLEATMLVPEHISPENSPFFDAFLSVSNPGNIVLTDVDAALRVGSGAQLPGFESPRKRIDYLRPGATEVVNWKIKVSDVREKTFRLNAVVSSVLTAPVNLSRIVSGDFSGSGFQLISSSDNVRVGDYWYVWIAMKNAEAFKDLDLSLKFDSSALQFVRVSPEVWLSQTGQLASFELDDNALQILGLRQEATSTLLRICKVHFRVKKAGVSPVTLKHPNGSIFVNCVSK